jgi:hypothetical protein
MDNESTVYRDAEILNLLGRGFEIGGEWRTSVRGLWRTPPATLMRGAARLVQALLERAKCRSQT